MLSSASVLLGHTRRKLTQEEMLRGLRFFGRFQPGVVMVVAFQGGPSTTRKPRRYFGESASSISDRLNAALSLTPNLAVLAARSAWMVFCSTHGRVASAARACCGQVPQVMPGTSSVPHPCTGFSGRVGTLRPLYHP